MRWPDLTGVIRRHSEKDLSSMRPAKSPDDLWSSPSFTSHAPGFSSEREDEVAEIRALFTRSSLSSSPRSLVTPSPGFTEAVMARVREQAQAQSELASVSPLVAPISFELTFERVREMARGVARSTWLLAAGLFIASWLAILTSPLFGFGVLTTGTAALMLHVGVVRYALYVITRVVSNPDTVLALMSVPILLFVGLVVLIQRSFPRLALDLF
jgi:hypothetical protein